MSRSARTGQCAGGRGEGLSKDADRSNRKWRLRPRSWRRSRLAPRARVCGPRRIARLEDPQAESAWAMSTRRATGSTRGSSATGRMPNQISGRRYNPSRPDAILGNRSPPYVGSAKGGSNGHASPRRFRPPRSQGRGEIPPNAVGAGGCARPQDRRRHARGTRGSGHARPTAAWQRGAIRPAIPCC